MVLAPIVLLLVKFLAGSQWVIVERAIHFLFSR